MNDYINEEREDSMDTALSMATPASTFEDVLTGSLKPKAAISYLRVSTIDQAVRGGDAHEGFSIPAQREANKKKAASIGAIIVKEFADRGASARSADRPELQKMLEYIEENQNQIDYVIVHKIDRLARNRGDDVDITRALTKAGVKLVSTTESIDESPSGMLLHGIMSSIAEFYSRNLSNEVIKGLSQKAKNGGTNYRAPLGYKNHRTIDELGREDKYVVVDEERAPLITLAFKYYATGDWSLNALAQYLASLGLTSRSTPKVPSKPVDKGMLNKILINPYYKGYVYFQRALYPGKQTPLIDEKTWQKDQDVLSANTCGERTRNHHHFLKSTVYCGHCHSRLIIHNARSHTGSIYPYFVCIGRTHKQTDCKMKAVLIDDVEREIEKLYERISISTELKNYLETWLNQYIKEKIDEFEAERSSLEREREKLERKGLKLLEAHYADAISLNLFKSEQDSINKALQNIDDLIKAHDNKYDLVSDNLKRALDLIEDCGKAYKNAPESIKRSFNQAIFEKILVCSNDKIEPVFASPFDILLDLAKSEIIYENPLKKGNTSLGNGDLEQRKNPVKNVFFEQGLTKSLMVGQRGLEPRTFCLRGRHSNQLSYWPI